MNKQLLAAAAVSLLLVGAGCGPSTSTTNTNGTPAVGPGQDGPGANAPVNSEPSTTANPEPRRVTVTLKTVGQSGQSGTAVLTDIAGNNTRVDITLGGKASDKSQPAAIYAGTCATQDAEVQYALSPVVNGKSTTTLNVNIGALVDKVAQAIKIKQDAVDVKLPFAACGELK